MIVDTSAFLAVVFREPGFERILEQMEEASKEMARQILQGLFDQREMKEMDQLYRPAKRPGKFEKDW